MHTDEPSALYPRGHAPQLLQLTFDNTTRPQYNPGHRVGLFTGPANKSCSITFFFVSKQMSATKICRIFDKKLDEEGGYPISLGFHSSGKRFSVSRMWDIIPHSI